jgi:hypothetical protein
MRDLSGRYTNVLCIHIVVISESLGISRTDVIAHSLKKPRQSTSQTWGIIGQSWQCTQMSLPINVTPADRTQPSRQILTDAYG